MTENDVDSVVIFASIILCAVRLRLQSRTLVCIVCRTTQARRHPTNDNLLLVCVCENVFHFTISHYWLVAGRTYTSVYSPSLWVRSSRSRVTGWLTAPSHNLFLLLLFRVKCVRNVIATCDPLEMCVCCACSIVICANVVQKYSRNELHYTRAWLLGWLEMRAQARMSINGTVNKNVSIEFKSNGMHCPQDGTAKGESKRM